MSRGIWSAPGASSSHPQRRTLRLVGEVSERDQDDFTAICEVAGGHKRFNPTAAGRFGIGFNSVYFLTDTPVLFSVERFTSSISVVSCFQRTVGGFSLDDFPAVASGAGAIKTVLEWTLPKAILGESSFQELAAEGQDYRHTIFRLPLRQTLSTGTVGHRGPVFPSASFPNEADRYELLKEMCEEARRSLLFLKSLRRVTFGGIIEKRFDDGPALRRHDDLPRAGPGSVRQICARHERRVGTCPAKGMFLQV